MRPLQRLISKWRQHRSASRLALIGEVANLVLQQHGQSWTSIKCPHCGTAASRDTANFCDWCGASLIPSPVPESSYTPYEVPDQHTSAFDLSAIKPLAPNPFVRPLPPEGRITSLIRTQEIQIPNDLQQLMRKALKGDTN